MLTAGDRAVADDLCAPRSHDDWIAIADRVIKNTPSPYLRDISNDKKITCAINATESALKDNIWLKFSWTQWPQKKNSQFRYLYYHDHEKMLKESSLSSQLLIDQELRASWRTLIGAYKKYHQYSPMPVPDAEANSVVRSARHPDYGVVPWLISSFRRNK